MIGFILWIAVGGVAGYIAERIMKEDHPIWINIALGIAGSFVANLVLGLLGYSGGGNYVGQLITGVIGAVILILAYREYERRK